MFWRGFTGWAQEDSTTQSLKCPNCGNTSDHYVYVEPYGLQLAFIFMERPLLGMKKYFLACSKCDHKTKEISKEQAEVMRKES